ncbi:class I SAM-dependent methyltransferase [Sulfurimonas sp. CVO]|jgi:SAM-dependent methyltransferase|uniref:Class I SAM-dependent methyltransferase n=1 Tax=Sulfurimonas xiamenensis TaxID=2590021 RepID=A0AAJ4DM06_9BACT|nr:MULTISPECIES: class I SAM-dependent methyltransferase [Sulfurimonas]PLY13194.1 MAG: class I SAM-dependent methyltransferase [Sulfurimonas sp.]QFR42516.1 class I SAM-dependent methyltransferase [Sulfurimonas xiamenensis]QHG91907.1 class I SAM-dependent methyltransferase [Sulfurimonas sp. CVO]
MPRIDNKTFYSTAIEKYGITAKGVNWHSKESQKLRFDILLEMLPSDLSSYSIADAGCGFGDLYLYMLKKKRAPKKYIGIDSLVDMYSIASERTGCEILIADICTPKAFSPYGHDADALPPADFYTCSGAMNVLEEFETPLFVRNCFSACRVAFIFNVLHGEKKSETYNYLTTKQIEQMARDLGVKKIILRDDYMQDDITVAFFKESI